jgi:hypothetical protein
LLFSYLVGDNFSVSPTKTNELYIGCLTEIEGELGRSGGQMIALFSQLAVAEVNSRADILPNHKIILRINETYNVPSTANAVAFSQVLERNGKLVGILGGTTSAESIVNTIEISIVALIVCTCIHHDDNFLFFFFSYRVLHMLLKHKIFLK